MRHKWAKRKFIRGFLFIGLTLQITIIIITSLPIIDQSGSIAEHKAALVGFIRSLGMKMSIPVFNGSFGDSKRLAVCPKITGYQNQIRQYYFRSDLDTCLRTNFQFKTDLTELIHFHILLYPFHNELRYSKETAIMMAKSMPRVVRIAHYYCNQHKPNSVEVGYDGYTVSYKNVTSQTSYTKLLEMNCQTNDVF